MKQWRVGTFSMGASLVLLGVILFFSQFKGWDVVTIFLSWWPFLLIVLGVEILVYVFMSKKENTFIKYDFLSIIFIGLLGTVALSFMFLSVSGLLNEIRYAVQTEERTFDLPAFNEALSSNIERIVLDLENEPVQIEGTSGRTFQVFGTYRTNSFSEEDRLIESEADYLNISKTNDTLYVKFKKLPEHYGFFHSRTTSDFVVLVPNDVQLEIEGRSDYENVTLSPRNLQANWHVEHSGYLNIRLEEMSDIEVRATLQSSHSHTEYESNEEKTWQTGDGTYKLNVVTSNVDAVNVTIAGKTLAASE